MSGMGERYRGKIALVTGGASGIGRATVAALMREGATVAFSDTQEAAGKAVAEDLAGGDGEVTFIRSDATVERDVADLVNAIVERYGRLDVAVNNVGAMAGGDRPGLMVHDTPLEAWNGTFQASVSSTFLCMKYEISHMLKQGGGSIANTASMAGIRVTRYGSAAYAAAKAGVVHLTEHAAVLYAQDNIRVNAVAPGLTETKAVVARFDADKRNAVAAEFHPQGRMITPDEIADAFVWVCSDQAGGVTGLTIPVAGGWAAR